MLILMLAMIAAEPDDPKLAAETQARTCAEAIIKQDYETLIDLTHPKVVAAGGGRETMIATARAAIEGMKKDGVTFDSCKVEPPPALLKTSDGLFCLVPLTVRMKAKDKAISARSALLAASTDDGKTWKFVDISTGEEEIRKLLPEVPKALRFPKPSKPEVEAATP